VHAFWVIPFLFKRDVVPGHPNSFEVTVTHTGVFEGKCTEYCGIDHDRMLFSVRAVSPADYQAWLAKAKVEAQQGTDKKLTVYRGPADVSEGPTGNTQRSHQ
jgi:cytochrome c oxidase subunit 2